MFKAVSELIKAVELGIFLTQLDKEGKIQSVVLEESGKLRILVKKDRILDSELKKLVEYYGFIIEY
jgi:hypothetical protein